MGVWRCHYITMQGDPQLPYTATTALLLSF